MRTSWKNGVNVATHLHHQILASALPRGRKGHCFEWFLIQRLIFQTVPNGHYSERFLPWPCKVIIPKDCYYSEQSLFQEAVFYYIPNYGIMTFENYFNLYLQISTFCDRITGMFHFKNQDTGTMSSFTWCHVLRLAEEHLNDLTALTAHNW